VTLAIGETEKIEPIKCAERRRLKKAHTIPREKASIAIQLDYRSRASVVWAQFGGLCRYG